jgi:3D (Asp-Asp-Asp) domain-containing protein
MRKSPLIAAMFVGLMVSCVNSPTVYRHDPVMVTSPLRLDGAIVWGAKRSWYRLARGPQYGDPVPVLLTSYCLSGTTRRGRYVRAGIIAADPRYFPLSRYVELYVGRKYYGRFLVDDTGRKIRGAHVDVWLSNCKDATRFGVKHGTAMLVPRIPEIRLAGKAE